MITRIQKLDHKYSINSNTPMVLQIHNLLGSQADQDDAHAGENEQLTAPANNI